MTRSQVLAQQLAQEQERTSDLTRRLAESEQIAARVSTLEQSLAAEQEKSKDLAVRLSEAERAVADSHRRVTHCFRRNENEIAFW